MENKKDGRTESIIAHSVNDFILRESNGKSLITVTKVQSDNRGKNALISFTAFPEDNEDEALEFLKRKRGEFREYIKAKTELSVIPWIDFEIDKGEKNRQKIERIKI